jgi:hypothetical protein
MNKSKQKLTQLLQLYLPKLILEVFGGAGAIWGFSEAIGLRHPDNIWFWRPIALFVGGMFWCRWVGEVKEFMDENEVDLWLWRGRVENSDECLSLKTTEVKTTTVYIDS